MDRICDKTTMETLAYEVLEMKLLRYILLIPLISLMVSAATFTIHYRFERGHVCYNGVCTPTTDAFLFVNYITDSPGLWECWQYENGKIAARIWFTYKSYNTEQFFIPVEAPFENTNSRTWKVFFRPFGVERVIPGRYLN